MYGGRVGKEEIDELNFGRGEKRYGERSKRETGKRD